MALSVMNVSGQGPTDLGLNQRPGINVVDHHIQGHDHVDGVVVLSSEESQNQSRLVPKSLG